MALADWSQRWFPDAFVFALAGLIVVFVTGALLGIAMRDLVKYFGEGFWSLIPFTMQMAIIIIGGAVRVVTPAGQTLCCPLSGVARTPPPQGGVCGVFLRGPH